MKIQYFIGSIAFALVVWPFTAISGDQAMMKFELLDNDGDGFISRSEATQNTRLRERWNNVDENKDGKLTAKEFATFAKVPKEAYPEE